MEEKEWFQVVVINDSFKGLLTRVEFGRETEVVERFLTLLQKLQLIKNFDFYSGRKN